MTVRANLLVNDRDALIAAIPAIDSGARAVMNAAIKAKESKPRASKAKAAKAQKAGA